jgi:TRAP-type C4-dicarboxylate transport system substrate-binding protein
MKITRRLFSLCYATSAVAFAFALTGSAAQAAPPAKIRLGTLVPKGSTYYQQLMAMGEKWRTSTNGAHSIVVYPDGSMGGEAEMVRRMRQGQLQAGLLTTVGLSQIEPAVTGLQNLPMMFEHLDDVDYVGEKLQPMLQKKLEAKGFVVLFWGDTGWVRIFSKKPVKVPDDLKPQEYFVWAGDQPAFELVRDLGLKPVSLETADILPSLKTGIIKSVAMPPFVALAAQVDTSAPYMLELNYAPLVGACVIRKDVWDQFTEAQRAEMTKASELAGKEFKAASRKESDEAVVAMQKRGLKVHKPTAAENETWKKFLEPAYPRIRGKIVPEDVFDEAKRLLDERHKAKGNG